MKTSDEGQRILRLEDPDTIPPGIRRHLERKKELLRATPWTEQLVRHDGPLSEAAEELSQHLRAHRILGYHCTREIAPGYFANNGLRATNLDQHQAELLRVCGDLFTADEVAYLRARWGMYFDSGQRKGREGLVWACLTRQLAVSSGTERFFKAYGGEAIHMPLEDDSPAMIKLMGVGTPVIVEVALPGDRIITGYDMAWCALNSYHRTVNPSAHPMESEARLRGSVPAEDVLAVVPLPQFVA